MPRIRAGLVALLACAAALLSQQSAYATTTTVFSSGFQSLPLTSTSWSDGSRHGAWRAVYNGYGVTGIGLDGSQVLSERPRASLTPGTTHASLVTTRASYGDTDVRVDLRTVAQLRQPFPNPWEVAWVLWHYTDDTHFYSLVLKPNGWELGKEDPAYPGAQRYLRTGSSPRFAVGAWHHVHIRQVGAAITVWADGHKLASVTDKQRPYSSGRLGLYNEDALVHFDHVRLSAP
jgi:hypothetical protein